MRIYRKPRGGRFYLYAQESYREGRKVRTRSIYLGPASEPYRIEPGEVAAYQAIWNDFEKQRERERAAKAAQWSQEKFLADTQGEAGAPVGDTQAEKSPAKDDPTQGA